METDEKMTTVEHNLQRFTTTDKEVQELITSDKDYLEQIAPKEILDYVRHHNGCNLQINFNEADLLPPYGHNLIVSVHLQKLTRTCNRCGYDELWNPDDSESKCGRHTYNKPRYDEVFTYVCNNNPWSLPVAFADWLNAQPGENDTSKPAVYCSYGSFR